MITNDARNKKQCDNQDNSLQNDLSTMNKIIFSV